MVPYKLMLREIGEFCDCIEGVSGFTDVSHF
jgi:hypothetical protein